MCFSATTMPAAARVGSQTDAWGSWLCSLPGRAAPTLAPAALHPVPLPAPSLAPPHLASRGRRGAPGPEGDEVRAGAGERAPRPVPQQERVQDAGLVDTEQCGQVLGLVQLGRVGLWNTAMVSSGPQAPSPGTHTRADISTGTCMHQVHMHTHVCTITHRHVHTPMYSHNPQNPGPGELRARSRNRGCRE